MAALITTILTLTSASFVHNDMIPARFTCDGQNISPALNWSGIPEGTQSLVLIVDDSDAPDPAAPKMTWVHWVLYNIPPSATGLPEGIAEKELQQGTLQGINDWKRTGYGGPCPAPLFPQTVCVGRRAAGFEASDQSRARTRDERSYSWSG
jgi:Raf kinase inhibitor-like YbhB/YbcL family protein